MAAGRLSGGPSLEPRAAGIPGGEPKTRPPGTPSRATGPSQGLGLRPVCVLSLVGDVWDVGQDAGHGEGERRRWMMWLMRRSCGGGCGCAELGVETGGLVRLAAWRGWVRLVVRCPRGGLGCGGVRVSPSARMWWLSGRRWFVERRRPFLPWSRAEAFRAATAEAVVSVGSSAKEFVRGRRRQRRSVCGGGAGGFGTSALRGDC
jgi:hypothetical protein